jgi:hypothetical protein
MAVLTETEELERRFWDGWYAHRNGLVQAMRLKQYEHQQRYIPLISKWGIGFRAPYESVVEIGCGPCGLAPWLGRGVQVGIEPLAEFHESKGVNYEALGYTNVFSGTLQEYMGLDPHPCSDLIVCCNVLDHDPDPVGLLEIMTRLGSRLFLAYDLRHTTTNLHPGRTDDIPTPKGWRVVNEVTLPPICDADQLNGTRIVLMEEP